VKFTTLLRPPEKKGNSIMAPKMDLFEKLKRAQNSRPTLKKVPVIFFRLHFDEIGAYLEVTDAAGKPQTVSYDYYQGPDRAILKAIERIRERHTFQIDWERAESQIYLHEHEYLLPLLAQSPHGLTESGQPLQWANGTSRVQIVLEEKKERLQSRLELSGPGSGMSTFRCLSEAAVYAEGTIYPIIPLNGNFQELPLFATPLLRSDLEKFFSLLFSRFATIEIKYGDYRLENAPPKTTKATILFEQVDQDNALHLRVINTLAGFDLHFFDDYEINRIAFINELERKIQISEIETADILECQQELETIFKKLRKQNKDGAYYEEDNFWILGEELARPFIQSELPRLLGKYALFGAEKLKSYKIRTVIPRLDLKLSHGIDFLEGEASLDIDGETFSLFELLQQYRKNAYIALSDGTQAIINPQYLDKLERLFQKKQNKVRLSFFDLPLIEELIDERVANQTFKRSREIFLGFNTIEQHPALLPELNAELRPYQQQGFQWLSYLHQHRLGGCLADDMGLGKTLQAIALLATIYPAEKRPSLIIMPRSLLYNWANEVSKFKPELSYAIYHGLGRNLAEARQKQLIFTTYATIRNDIEKLKDEEFYAIILDESQNIKNINSQSSQAVLLLQSQFRLALSGTPIENNLGELYALFRFLNPAMFGSIDRFNTGYAGPIQKMGDKEALQELRRKIYPFILRRLKKDVLKELPDKIEQILYVEMSPDQKTLYEQRRRFYQQAIKAQIQASGLSKSQFFILQAFLELRQIASIPESKSDNEILSPKREMLIEQIIDVVANNHKVLVFANFLQAIDSMAEELEKAGIEFLVMTGATRDRQALVEQFQTSDRAKVFLLTLKTGGLGLNLTAADHIFIFDPWWNKSAENQAMDRAHRIGQDKTVFSYKLITRGTIEEKILELQTKKKELFESLIVSDGASLKSLDERDVDFVLGE
jgi:SNF2 family DNA or RNA helicase